MGWFNNLKISVKLVILVGLLLLGLIINGFVGFKSSKSWETSIDQFNEVYIPVVRNLNMLDMRRMEVRAQTNLVYQFEDAKDAAQGMPAIIDDRQNTWKEIDGLWGELSKITFDPLQQSKFGPLTTAYNNWRESYIQLDRVMGEIAKVSNNYQLEKLMDEYRNYVGIMLPMSVEMANKLAEMNAANRQETNEFSERMKDDSSGAVVEITSLVLIVFLIAVILAFIIIRSITRPIGIMVNTLQEVDRTGDFSLKINYQSKDEIGMASAALGNLLGNLQKALGVTNEVVGAISRGDFSKRIEGTYAGDLARLQSGVNNSAESINTTMKELGNVIEALNNGQFNLQIEAKLEGDFGRLLTNVDGAMASLNETISGVVAVMHEMQEGHFEARVTTEAKGDLSELKESINDSMNTLGLAIQDITRIVVAQSQGDLTQEITNDYQGDLDTLKQAINKSISGLDEIVAVAVAAANSVGSAAGEVAQGAMDLSQRVQEQAAAVEQSSATMEEFNVTVQNNAESAKEANRVGHEVETKTQQASEVMQQTIEAMTAIQESSHKISEIVTMIDSIAFQTNLLALNAAVEAARAGDHGRGFAVVAGEVRALAQKSAEAARDITSLINESVTRIDEGTKLATESGEVIADITRSMTDMAGMNEHISQASGEQAEGVSQLQMAISQIDQVTQQNAALVEETSAAAESMRDQANTLTSRMAFFKTTNRSGAPMIGMQSNPGNSPRLAAPAKAAAKPAAPVKSPVMESAATEEWAEF